MSGYDPGYTGCPVCGAMEDVDCRCTGFVTRLRAGFERRCTCGAKDGAEHAIDCPLCEVTVIMLSEARAFGRHADEPSWDRPPPQYKSD